MLSRLKGDLDPDVEICKRRVTALRRCYHRNDDDAAMIQDIYEKYKGENEPATKHTKEDLRGKDVLGPPASKERASLRKQCRPHGPVGLLLETMHLQTAAMTDKFIIKQWSQPAIDVLQAPHQHLPALIQQMCTRNRTRMAENEPRETGNPVEIDAYATSRQMKEINNEDLMQLNLVRTGSLWTKSTAYWTGRDDEKTCSICQEEAETAEHIIWRCKPLAKKRKEADSILAGIDCKLLPAPVRHGIAAALKATMPGTFWGTTGEELPEEARRRCGCDERDGMRLPETFKDICKQITARECMQGATARSEEMMKLPMPPRIRGKPPEKPNGYTDGSYVNSAGNFWGLGGVGVWWPTRQTQEGLAQAEEVFTYVEQLTQGTLMWQTFNDLRGSSTRCEIGAMLLAMLREIPIHIGTDSQAMLTKLQQMLEHAASKEQAELYTHDGRMKLGGNASPLQSETPFKKHWHQQQDGDLWEIMNESIQSRGHESIKAKKVKGHATEAMIEAGLVEPEDKDGNDWADAAAGRGTNKFSRLATMARQISIRHERYRQLMASIHKFIISMLKAHKEEVEVRKKQADPLGNKENMKQHVARRLDQAEGEGSNERIGCAQLPPTCSR